MRRYETIMIIDPDLPEEERHPLFDKFKDQIPQDGGLLIDLDEWGIRKLAYEVKKKARGFYLRMDYCGNGSLVDELERLCRIDDRVLKYMTVLLDESVDMEQMQKDVAEKQAKSEAEEQEKAAAAEPAPSEDASPEEVEKAEPEADEKATEEKE